MYGRNFWETELVYLPGESAQWLQHMMSVFGDVGNKGVGGYNLFTRTPSQKDDAVSHPITILISRLYLNTVVYICDCQVAIITTCETVTLEYP